MGARSAYQDLLRRFLSGIRMAERAPGTAPLPSVATEGLPGEESGRPLRFPPGAATVHWLSRAELKEVPVAVQRMGRILP